MLRTLALLLLLAAPAMPQDASADAASRVFVEVVPSRESVFVMEPLRIELVVGFDRRWFREHAVALFPRRMDVRLRVRAPWLADLPGAEPLEREEPRGETLSFALNDEVARAARREDRVVGGRPFTVLSVARTFLPVRPGTLEVPAATLRFAYATEFEDDFVSGSRPVNRREATVRGTALSIPVREPPAEGRPAGYTGAVGRFTVRAEAAPREVRVGESLKLVLRIGGEGNLDRFDPPRLASLPGFHVFGSVDDRAAPVRTITYDLAALDETATEVPAVAFSFFDPGPPAAYRTVRTDPVPLRVLPGEEAAPAGAGEPEAPPEARPAPFPTFAIVLIAAALAIAAASAVVALVRGRTGAREEPDPEEERAREAAAALLRAIDAGNADLADAFAGYLAARLRVEPAAVISPALPSRLAAAGVPEDLAARAAALLEGLVAARYGAGAAGGVAEQARAVLGELEQALAAGA